MTPLVVAGRRIGPGFPVFIIAEAGVNHNAELGLAIKLVEAAEQAGADAVKFQTWVTEKLVVQDAPLADYQRANVGRDVGQFEMLKRLELSYDDFRRLKEYSDRRKYLFFSTPDEEDSADFLESLGVALFKIGSGEVTNLPLLRHVARMRKPLILSTGMSTLEEVSQAVAAIRGEGNPSLALLHCVSNYPADPMECNLRAMDTLAAAFGCPVGFSDHTLGMETAIAAVARGAAIIEKHLTLDRTLPGPDHRASLDPVQFGEFVRALRQTERSLGNGVKVPTPSELETRKAVQKVIVSAREIAAGRPLSASDLCLRRGAAGMPPAQLPGLLGRVLKQNLEGGRVLRSDMLQ